MNKGPTWGEEQPARQLLLQLWESGSLDSDPSCADVTRANLPEPQFPHLLNGIMIITHPTGCCEHWIMKGLGEL